MAKEFDSNQPQSPFFIVGASRSGTTWLQRTLNTHPEVLCKGEGAFFGRSFKGHENIQSLHAALSRSEELRIWHGRRVWTEGEFDDFLLGLIRMIVDSLFQRNLQKKPGAKIVGDKTPHYATSLDEIQAVYPEASILHIIRDGRDTAISNLFNSWRRAKDKGGPLQVPQNTREKRDRFLADPKGFSASGESIFVERTLRNLARRWKTTVEQGIKDGEQYFGERYFQTNYEALLERPETELPRLLKFLGVSTGDDFVNSMVEENSFERLTGGRESGLENPNSFLRKGISGDWKNYFTERDRRIFDEEAGELLEKLGYERPEEIETAHNGNEAYVDLDARVKGGIGSSAESANATPTEKRPEDVKQRNPERAPGESGQIGHNSVANNKRGVGELHESRRSYMAELYPAWLAANRLRPSDLRRLRREAEGLEYRPRISLVLPVFDPQKEWLEQALDSVLAQVYPEWELCVCDDASTQEHVREVLERYERLDGRIKVKHLRENSGISGASNAALSLAGGEFVGLMDHDDELSPDALFEVARLLQERPEADLIYSDEDKMDEEGTRFHPNFKPDWSPELLFSCNYISHLSVLRRSLLEEIGGFREGFEGCQDFDLLLRATERTQKIHHIPKVLYHWRTVTGSTASSDDSKSYIRERAHRALRETLERRGLSGTVGDGFVPNRFRVSFEVRGEPKVSIVIPTRDHRALLENCVESIERLTTYTNYEILIVDNQSQDPATVEYLRSTPHRVLTFDEEFNFARINNFAVSHADGEYVVFLNDDTEVISAGWLEEMLGHAGREEIGAVGARLLYPNGRIQHAGVVTGVGNPWQRGVAAHSHQHYPRQAAGHAGSLQLTRNYSAVTAACMMVRKDLFEGAGGFDEENLKVNFNDVDLCLKLREQGFRIVYTPFAELYHHESVSRGFGGGYPEEPVYMKRKWGEALNHDPYYNPNLSTGAADFNLPAGALRPDAVRGGLPPRGAEDPERLPQEMEREERQEYMQAQHEMMRDSLRTTLVPAKKPSANGGRKEARQRERPVEETPTPGSTPQPGVFFVIGQPKSGTSWVRSTLDSHPQICCLGEGKFFGRDFKKGNPSSGGRLPSMYSMFADSKDLRTWIGGAGHWIGGAGDREKLHSETERHTKGLAKAAMDYFFQDARERTGKPLVGDKTPAHTGYLQEIHEFYPESKIIHIIRDGRDQAVSSVFHWWREADRPVFSGLDPGILEKKRAYYEDKSRFGPEGESIFTEDALRSLARGWRRNVENAMQLGPRLFGDDYFETRYEDLLLEPEEIFEQMISLLGADADKRLVQKCVEKNSFQSRAKNRKPGEEDQGSFFRKGISGDWKNYFTEADRRIFDEETGDLLEKLGYDRNVGSNPRSNEG